MECAICMDTIVCDKLTIEQCHHVFHSKCLARWKENNKSCPTCRADLDVGLDVFGMQDLPDEEFNAIKAFFRM